MPDSATPEGGTPKRGTRIAHIGLAVREIAAIKMADLSANDVDAAAKIIEGTARSMGIDVAG